MKLENKIYKPVNSYGFHLLKDIFTFLPAKDLPIGTKVICLEARLCGSIASWLQNTSKNHGAVKISGEVVEIKPNGERVVKLNEDQRKSWAEPIGNERVKSYIGGVGFPVDHIIEIVKEADDEL